MHSRRLHRSLSGTTLSFFFEATPDCCIALRQHHAALLYADSLLALHKIPLKILQITRNLHVRNRSTRDDDEEEKTGERMTFLLVILIVINDDKKLIVPSNVNVSVGKGVTRILSKGI